MLLCLNTTEEIIMKNTNKIKLGICMLCLAFGGNAIAAESHDLRLAAVLGERPVAKEESAKLTDNQLADKVRDAFVKEKLYGKEKFADMGIHVTAKKGVVTITGRVASKDDEEKAVKIAKGVDQVKNVKSEVSVKKEKKDDKKK